MSEHSEKAYRRFESEYVRVVRPSRSVVKVNISELEWERVCQSEDVSCANELVGVMRVRVYACQSSK